MSHFSLAQKRNALSYLVIFHLVIIASSNYLVQIPFTVWGYHTTWGAFTFPFIFLATDLTVRIYGPALARRIIFIRDDAVAADFVCAFGVVLSR